MARKLEVTIVGDARQLEKSFKRASSATRGFGKDMQKAGRNASKSRGLFGGMSRSVFGLAGAFVGTAGLASAAHAAFSEMADAQKVTAQTNAALKSTKGVANVTAKQVDDLATSLMNLSGTDDEVIKSGENMLLTFTNIRNEVGKGNRIFDEATKTALDMSTALGQDMKQSALQLGKALNDPIKGVTALRRVGVQFTDAQKDQIKALVKSGKTLEAQKIILKELQTEFGGSAKAAGDTLPGKLNKLRNTVLNLAGSIAEMLTPSLTRVIDSATKWLTNAENQKRVMDTVKQIADALARTFNILKGIFEALNRVTGSTINTLKLLFAALLAIKTMQVAASITNTARSIGLLGTSATTTTGSVKGLRGSFAGKAGLAAGVVLAGYELSTFIRKIPGWDNAMKSFGGTIHDVAANLGLVHDPMEQFKGKKVADQGATAYLRKLLAQLEAKGLTPKQAAAAVSRTHPNIALRDLQVLAGVFGKRPGVVVNGGVHLHGVQNVRQLEEELMKRQFTRPQPRRGP